MYSLQRWFVRQSVLFISLFFSLWAAHADIPLAGVTEVSGPAAIAGTSFKNGYTLAVNEVNAKGGVLGQKLILTQFDIETSPDAAKTAMSKALETKPFAILGPVFSGITVAVMPLTAVSKVPHFTGGEAASLTTKFHPSLLRTTLSQQGSAPRLATLTTTGLGIQKIGLIWVDNEFGRFGREALLTALNRKDANLVFEAAVKPNQKDMTDIIKGLKQSGAQGVLLYLNENESIEILKQLKSANYDQTIVADGLTASRPVLDAVGEAAEGMYVHMNISPNAPSASVQRFVKRYEEQYKSKPDHNAMKGYTAIYIMKAGIEMIGKLDQSQFLKTLKDNRIDQKNYPDLFGSVHYDFFGNLNRESYYARVQNNNAVILATIPAAEGGSVTLTNGQKVSLASTEFRIALRGAPVKSTVASKAYPSKSR